MKAIKNPIEFIHNSPQIRPLNIEMSDLKWKYLIRSAIRSKNIMMVGPAGSGKTMTAKAIATALQRPFYEFNMGSTQDPRASLIGNTHFIDNETMFAKSKFIQAITTPYAVVLLDEITRVTPEGSNILMTILDEEQRYVRLDEDIDSPKIQVAEGVCFIATANMGSEYTGTRQMDRALKDRFEIVEVDVLSKENEQILLTKRFPELDPTIINAVADIADLTRKDWKSENGELETFVSTRMTVRVCELVMDKFKLEEACDVAILPFFEDSGADSQREYLKQMIQKHMKLDHNDPFNLKKEVTPSDI